MPSKRWWRYQGKTYRRTGILRYGRFFWGRGVYVFGTYGGYRKVSTAQAILADGITKHPNRLDFRLGKIALHLEMAENTLAVQEITSALEQSITNGNKWCTTLDAPVETDGISFLRECIQTYFMQLISADDLPSAENIVNTCLHFYPQDAIFLTDKGTLRFLQATYPQPFNGIWQQTKSRPTICL